MSSTTYAVAVDCPNMIELARGLGMQTARPDIWTALQGDCCSASSVDCDVNQRVTQIFWNSRQHDQIFGLPYRVTAALLVVSTVMLINVLLRYFGIALD